MTTTGSMPPPPTPSPSSTTKFEREIFEQPACLARLLSQGRDSAETIATAVRRFDPTFVVTAARGSSDNAARYAKYLFGAHNRLVVSLGAPSLITLYGAAPRLERALVLGISQSGQSPDIVALVQEARRQGALTVAMTNEAGSPLAAAAEYAFDLRAGPERAVVASKSYTCQLLGLGMLSAALEARPERWEELQLVPDAAAATLSLNADPQVAAGIAPLAGAERMLVLGRGFNFATAFEIALKIKETAHVLAEAYASPDLFHGPLAMIGPGFPALVIAPTGATLASMTEVLDALEARGAAILTISDAAALWARPGTHLRLTTATPEWLSPIIATIPGQLCALRMSQSRHLNPDHPRGLAKVTKTR